MPIFFTFTTSGSLPQVGTLTAKTWCLGNRVDLSWGAPVGVVSPQFRLKRSTRTFSLQVDDDTELIYAGTADSFTDVNLEDNTIYYYSLYWSEDGINWIIDDSGRVAGLSITDYQAEEGTHWLYDLLPAELRRLDAAQVGDNQYTLRRYCDVLQCGFQLMRGYKEAYSLLPNADKMPAGRIGEPENQYGFLEALNEQLGFDPQRALGLEVMRRVALGITHVRKKKGTCPGLADFIKLLTGWDGECKVVTDGKCGGGYLLRTWDGFSPIRTGSGHFDGPTFTSSTLDRTAGQFSDSAAAFVPHEFQRGILADGFGGHFCIADNTATQIIFEKGTDQVTYELIIPAAQRTGTDPITWTLPPGSKPFNLSEFVGYKVKDSAGTVRTIVSATPSSDVVMVFDLSGTVAAGDLSLAADFANEPKTYANRQPVLNYKVYSGEHYRLFDCVLDLRLKGTEDDPYAILWGGGSVFGGFPVSDSDVIFWVPGVATLLGTVAGLTASSITTSGLTPDALVGSYLNPNRNQNTLVKIISNTATQIDTDPSQDLTLLAENGNQFFVLSPMEAVRYQAVYNTVKRFLPFGTRLFLWFN